MRSRGRISERRDWTGDCFSARRQASSRASSSAWRLDWVPPLVKTPSAAVAEADALGGPVDQPALDEGAAGALVPGVQRGVDGGEHRLAEQRGDDDRAVEVGEVARVVEVDRVPEVDALQLVERGGRVAERRVQVDRRHLRGPAAAVRHQ